MDKPTTFEQFSKALLNKFVIHFAPGIILFFTFLSLTDVRLERGLLSSLIVVSFSWIFGVVLEIVFFKKSYDRRVDNQQVSSKTLHSLLLSKIGLTMLFAVGVNAFFGVLEILTMEHSLHFNLALVLSLKTVIFGGLGLFLFLYFRKGVK